jgi:hypothetical protein
MVGLGSKVVERGKVTLSRLLDETGGKVKANRLPRLGSLSAQIEPPCFSTINLQRASPKPVPLV